MVALVLAALTVAGAQVWLAERYDTECSKCRLSS